MNFLPAEDYLFGDPTRVMPHGSEQGGIYLRAFRSLRVEDWPAERVRKMHEYFSRVQSRGERTTNETSASFSLLLGPLLNLWSSYAERGNCAFWTSRGLIEAGLFKRATIWPKMIFLKLYMQSVRASALQAVDAAVDKVRAMADSASETIASAFSSNPEPATATKPADPAPARHDSTGPPHSGDSTSDLRRHMHERNMSIVAYACQLGKQPRGWLAPHQFMSARAHAFRDLERFANVIVELAPVPDAASSNSTTAAAISVTAPSAAIGATASKPRCRAVCRVQPNPERPYFVQSSSSSSS